MRYDLPHRDDPNADLDMASAGVGEVLDGQSGARDPRDRRYQICRGSRRPRSTR